MHVDVGVAGQLNAAQQLAEPLPLLLQPVVPHLLLPLRKPLLKRRRKKMTVAVSKV